MTPLSTARTAYALRTVSARWFTAPLLALALIGSGAGTSSAAPADDADHPAYVQSETEPAFTDPSARVDDLPPYDARDAQQAVDAMVMDEEEETEGQHCPPSDEDRATRYDHWGPHRDDAYPAEGGGDGQDAPSPRDDGDDQGIVG
ncbi:hypothetical protein ACGFW5_30860 [Streptomyces sp. NPDC048416]|uniref:hypothetical protein n=1 Tax=Streptomyces sp. NPDC048416 TaxID=3365546 RepID=UPI00371DCF66